MIHITNAINASILKIAHTLKLITRVILCHRKNVTKKTKSMEPREKIWLEMIKFHGLKEVPGPVSDPIIIEWFKELGYDWVTDDSETAWCSCCLNIMAKRAGLEYTGKLDARSWMKIGQGKPEPQIGDVVVYWRGQKTGWQGHVGLFAGYNEDKSQIFTLGGNQANMLGIRAYPVSAVDFGLLGFRELFYRQSDIL